MQWHVNHISAFKLGAVATCIVNFKYHIYVQYSALCLVYMYKVLK